MVLQEHIRLKIHSVSTKHPLGPRGFSSNFHERIAKQIQSAVCLLPARLSVLPSHRVKQQPETIKGETTLESSANTKKDFY